MKIAPDLPIVVSYDSSIHFDSELPKIKMICVIFLVIFFRSFAVGVIYAAPKFAEFAGALLHEVPAQGAAWNN